MTRKGNLILYGTQTGTAEDLGGELQEALEEMGVKAGCENVFDIEMSRLSEVERVFVLISTWGDGDPPDDAEGFCEWLEECDSGALNGLEYGVFGLGDSGYEQFCECGKFVDAKMEAAGGRRILERVDCDIDIDGPFAAWLELVKQSFGVPAIS
ncbi:flavodoxin domain-containing protein [Rubritalea tangerina]|uniref:Flavodoxin domain-containing protein n=1 Tax=Rubritalea tangerina TaxID=430798 RepID=A0ABW4ZAU9_9BACT